MAFLLHMRRRKKGEQAAVDPEILASLVSERTQLVDWAEVSRSMKGEDGYWWRSMVEQALTWRFSFQHTLNLSTMNASVFVQEDRYNLSFYFCWFSTRTRSRNWVMSLDTWYWRYFWMFFLISCLLSKWWILAWVGGLDSWDSPMKGLGVPLESQTTNPNH